MKMTNAGDTIEYFGKKYIVHEVEFDSNGHINLSCSEVRTAPVTGYTGSCSYRELGSSETKILGTVTNVKLDPDVLTLLIGLMRSKIPNSKSKKSKEILKRMLQLLYLKMVM